MDDCPRKDKWIGPCNFEARYDSEPHNGAGFSKIANMTGSEAFLLLTKRVYVRDVCTRCGRTIER